MQHTLYPDRSDWPLLCKRSGVMDLEKLDAVKAVMHRVRDEGDEAVLDLTRQFDSCELEEIRLDVSVFEIPQLSDSLRDAIDTAVQNIRKFHRAQRPVEPSLETIKGIECRQIWRPLERVGLYIPGGTAPLFSSLLMLAIPAMVAGCKELIVATPPNSDGSINSVMLYTAKRLGISEIYRMGGAQAIAAMTYGTQSVPKVDKLFGPGNTYVTLAKQLAQLEGVPIDMPAGPSEVLVIADRTANPSFLAADLLSQAEHGPDSQVMLVTTESKHLEEVENEIARQLGRLSRKDIALNALKGSHAIVVESLTEAVEFSNLYAPEHLILAVESPEELVESVTHAGSLFLGHYTPESMGDYASGTNHTLPTNGYARNYSGVSLTSFMKSMTVQKASKEGLRMLGPAVENLAEAEGLTAHKQAVTVRLETLHLESLHLKTSHRGEGSNE